MGGASLANVANVPATFDAATATNVTLSNGGLTATHSNTTGNSGVRGLGAKNSGKAYFEMTCTDFAATGGCVGLMTAAATYTNFVTDGTNSAVVYRSNGNIWANGANSLLSLGAISDGDIIGIAVDLDNDKVWFRKAPSGNWNGQVIGSQNPAGNVGGASISNFSGTTLRPAVGYGAGAANDVVTANFGASAFSGTPPSGFTRGWMI